MKNYELKNIDQRNDQNGFKYQAKRQWVIQDG